MEKFIDTIENFLLSKKGDSEEKRTVETYRKKITMFADYLIEKRSADDTNYGLILKSLAAEQIIESMESYVEKSGVKYKSTAENYITVIKEYFKFIQKEYDIDNDNFTQNHRLDILKEAVEQKAKDLKLNPTQQCEPLSKSECNKLIAICNEKIDLVSDVQVVKDGYNSDYALFISGIIIKLLLYTGMKINTLAALEVSDYDAKINKLRINSFWVHLPDDLARQLQRYANIRAAILPTDSSTTKLFFNRNSPNSLLSNSQIFGVLDLAVGHKKSVAISKFTIIEMIKKHIPSYVIMEFTGYKSDVYDHCSEIASQEMSDFKSRDLDAKMRSLDLFDKL